MHKFSMICLILLFSTMSSNTFANIPLDEHQPRYTPTGKIFSPPTAELPWACDFVLPWWCTSDSDYEYKLEQEFWGHIGNGNYEGLAQWNQRAKQYASRAKGMTNKVEARIQTFISFSHVGLYVQDAIFNPVNIMNVLAALMYSSSAMKLDPDSPNLQSLHYYLNTYLGYAMSDAKLGRQHIDNLANITHTYGPVAGSEGILVGSLANMYLIDDDSVREGLTTLNDCNTISCRRNTSVAPYKEIGMQIAIAEGHARLGDMTRMETTFNKARSFATEHNYPYPDLLDTVYKELTQENGVIDQWNSPLSGFMRLGNIQLPLPPSAGALACQSCHASGFQTTNHYE